MLKICITEVVIIVKRIDYDKSSISSFCSRISEASPTIIGEISIDTHDINRVSASRNLQCRRTK